MAISIDGKKWASFSRERTRAQVQALHASSVVPKLVVILVGDNPASRSYVRGKERAAKEVGIESVVVRLPATSTQAEVVAHVVAARDDQSVHGILVQLPLPEHIDERAVLAQVPPEKDVDGFHPANVGALVQGDAHLIACTPLGVMRLLEYEGIEVAGRHAVVIGRSNIVGKPLALLLLQANATVTICHSRTRDLPALTRQADILVAAVGRAHFVTADMVKPGAVVIDVGINRVGDALVGDVDTSAVAEVAGAITPVPGGVGPMTIAMLLSNTVVAARASAGK
ncbi:MAG: bifunctional methylenetetrahydrofolate dehydrogenase/methenyltetrahydrofolate cyclohydrolase FolD [Firmicutes bacterium]|nr:bifunctional methylenetetrahydrofolate dehydrogenase/methenyltetrahydrofolate cyclohydrolase FolD [Bacillota bacterium]